MNFIDLTGKTFGRLTVIKRLPNNDSPCGQSRTMWLCQCTCGKTAKRASQELKRNNHVSCGCWKSELISERRSLNLVGKRFGRLIVLGRVKSDKEYVKWRCKCDCGKEIVSMTSNLTSGHTKSCGCYSIDRARELSTKHNMYGTRVYKIWCDMKARCENPKEQSYKLYGGRGIKVCSEWQNANSFINWALQNGYRDDLTIERIDYNGNYEPKNCKWATLKEQARNKRNNFYIAYLGKTQPLAAWCEELNLGYYKTYARIRRYHWSIEEAFTK